MIAMADNLINEKRNYSEKGRQQSLLAQVPKILKAKHLKCVEHTPASASVLHESYGFFATGKEIPHDVEQTLFDAFIEDDYDGQLHLSTLHDTNSKNCSNEGSIGPPLGLVFWREVPENEMNDWLDWDHVVDALDRHTSVDNNVGEDTTVPSSKKNRFVRQNSIESIQKMIESLHLENDNVIEGNDSHYGSTHDEMVHAWTKLELIAVRERYWGRHLGSLLLACTLYNAHSKFDQSRVVLHIAGGEDNAPALRLYERFGFLRVRSGTSFHKPDRYMYILGDIAFALDHTVWKGDSIEHIDPHEEDYIVG
jgi:GNAT superfamily N-acetyltransferase